MMRKKLLFFLWLLAAVALAGYHFGPGQIGMARDEAARHVALGAKLEETFGPEDVERARIIDLCVRRGFDAEVIARAEAREKLLSRYLDQVFPNGIGATYSLAQTAEMTGVDSELVARLWDAIASEDLAERTHPEDVEMLRGWKVALDAGFPEEALFQVVRVYVDALGRVAEAESRLFHFYVHERRTPASPARR